MNKIIVKESKMGGKGVFAVKDIKKGEIIISWHPKKIVSRINMKKLSIDEQNHTTPDGHGKYIIMGEPERYVNHSCNPNSYVNKKRDVAMRKIKKGEEITSDYSINGVDSWEMNCNCGSKICRRIVSGDFFKLPKSLQKRCLPYLEPWFMKKFRDKLVAK